MTLFWLDLILVVNPSSIIVSEDGTGENVVVSKIGYSFGEVNFILSPLTYSEYESLTDGALDNLFPLRPPTPADSETHTQHYSMK